MFRWLVRLGNFPACRSQANVIPIPKGPPSSYVANYRPIFITSALSDCCLFVLDDLWNAVVYFNHLFCLSERSMYLICAVCPCPTHWKVHWRVRRRIGSCRLISVQPVIGSTIRAFSISSPLWILEVLCCLH